MKTKKLYTLACRKCGHLFDHMISDTKGRSIGRFESGVGLTTGEWIHTPIKEHDIEEHADDKKFYAVKEVVLIPFKRGVRQR